MSNSKRMFFGNDSGDTYPEWEKKSLGEMGQFYRGLTYGAQDVKEYGNLVLRSTNIQDGKLVFSPDVLQFVSKEIPERLILANNDIAVCMANGSKRLVGKSATYDDNLDSQTYPITVGAFCSILRPTSPITRYLLQTSIYSKEIDVLLAGSAINNLKNTDLEKIVFNVPSSLPEQQKIAEFFSALDERIALTADKLKLLKGQKQGYQQQVFNRELVFTDDNGDTYPDWEEKQLKELSAFISDGDWIESKDQSEEGIRILQTGNVGQGFFVDKESRARFISPKRAKEINCVFLESKDILVSRLPDPAGRACFVPERLEGSVTVVDCAIIRANDLVIGDFLLQYMQYNDYYVQVNKMLSGSTRKRISRSSLELIKIKVPSLSEQKKIAEFFSALDEQIELAENKLALLKEQKKGYLQGIFG